MSQPNNCLKVYVSRSFSSITNLLLKRGYSLKEYDPSKNISTLRTQNGDLKIYVTIDDSKPVLHLEGSHLDNKITNLTQPTIRKYDLQKLDVESLVNLVTERKPSTGKDILTSFFTSGVSTFGKDILTIQDKGSNALVEVNTSQAISSEVISFTVLTPTALRGGTDISYKNNIDYFATYYDIIVWLKYLLQFQEKY